MYQRTTLARFSDVLDLVPLPWASGIRQVVLSKRDDCIHAARTTFNSQLPETIRRSIPARQYEYLLGRLAAGVLLSECGVNLADCWVHSQQRRPIWPKKIIGSIAHSNQLIWVAAGLAQRPNMFIGTDVESLEQSNDVLRALDLCYSSDERQIVSSVKHGRLIGFTAKEALFKCLNPICDVLFGFLDAKIVKLDSVHQTFVIELRISLSAELTKQTLIQGEFRFFLDHVWAGIKWVPGGLLGIQNGE